MLHALDASLGSVYEVHDGDFSTEQSKAQRTRSGPVDILGTDGFIVENIDPLTLYCPLHRKHRASVENSRDSFEPRTGAP